MTDTTWNGKIFQYRSAHSGYDADVYDSYSCDYQPTANILTIHSKCAVPLCFYDRTEWPQKLQETLMGQEESFALYKTLRNWIRVYQGENVLQSLDKAELEQ